MEKRLGRGEEKGRSRRFYCILNYSFSETEFFDWSPTCQSVNNKNLSVPKESNFHGSFYSTWRTDSFCKLHSSFQMEAQVFKEANRFCGTWTIFEVKIFPLSRTIEISVRDNEKTISNSLPGL